MDIIKVLPLHHNKKYQADCCKLINDEWKRSETARMRSLDCSCDNLPTSLILLQNDSVIGHLKLSSIPNILNTCFVESVVIKRGLRGKGFGTILMDKAEDYARTCLKLNCIYLSTKGQEGFYKKLGYVECPPVSIYGSYVPQLPQQSENICNNNIDCGTKAPKPPPLPTFNGAVNNSLKTYMKKDL